MLRWMSWVTREDRIRNEYIRESIGVSEAVKTSLGRRGRLKILNAIECNCWCVRE